MTAKVFIPCHRVWSKKDF